MTLRMPHLMITAGALLATLATFSGCDEKDVPYFSDTDEIERYIYTSEDAIDLFRVDQLFLSDPVELPWEPGVLYVLTVDSTRRAISMVMSSEDILRRVGSLPSYLRDAEVTVDDVFYISQRRIEGTDTTTEKFSQALNRYGYFLKLGQDNQAYLGWKLWGYNGGTGTSDQAAEVYLTFRREDGVTFLGNSAAYSPFSYVYPETTWVDGYPEVRLVAGLTVQSYRRLDQIDTLDVGDSLIAAAAWNRTAAYLLTAYTQAGLVQERMEPAAAAAESLVVHTPDPNSRIWNVIALQEFLRRPIPGSNPPAYTVTWAGWTVPYRTPQ